MYENPGYWLVWLLVTAPLFGGGCALLAKELGRRAWPWFLFGFFFNVTAITVLGMLWLYQNHFHKLRELPCRR